MKLLTHGVATNPRRVHIYLAEKDLALPLEIVDVRAGAQRLPAFLAKNRAGKVPVLELDDGSYLTESGAIIEYLEELHPEPPLIGRDPVARARTRECDRIVALLIDRTGVWLHHSHAFFADRGVQSPEVVKTMAPLVEQQLDALEQMIGDRPFLTGENVTIADCSLLALFQTTRGLLSLPFGAEHPRLDAWFERFSARPSAAFE